MGFIKKLAHLVFLIILIGCGGYFLAYNLDYININIPQSGEVRIRAAVAYIIVFVVGVMFTTLHFGYSALKNAIHLAAKNHKIKKLEAKLSKLEAQLQQLQQHQEPQGPV